MSAAVEQYVMTEAEAHQVTEDIRHNAKSFTEYRARMMHAVDRAKAGSAHIALGYRSWTEYLSEVLGEEPMRLARAERQDMVRMLSDEGMSTRAIAGSLSVSKNTVTSDLSQSGTPEPAPDFVDTTTGEIHDRREVKTTPQKTTGMDGKTYTKPAPLPKPRAEAITSQFTSAVVDLNRVLDRFHRIQTNSNFAANKNQVAALHGNDLDRAISELKNLAESLN